MEIKVVRNKMADKIKNFLQDAKTIAILGHVRPDGDCIGSCLGLYHYITSNWKECEVTVFLEEFDKKFLILKDADKINNDLQNTQVFDLAIACDVASKDRLGDAENIFDRAKRTLCIDHHLTNTHYADETYLVGGLSATGEVLCQLVDFDFVNVDTASCLYLAIAHDTGIFKFSATTEDTMVYAGKLLSKGIDKTKLIDDTYNSKTYNQKRVCGKVLMESELLENGQIILGKTTLEDLETYQLTTIDLDGIIDQLRVVCGIEVAVYIYETAKNHYKVSMRSNGKVKVSDIAVSHGGGGHIWAAGCNMEGSYGEIRETIISDILVQLKEELA
jgi:phosphoesterase RecJ-like protein